MHSVDQVYVDGDYLVIFFSDSRLLCLPLVWFPKLKLLSADQIANCEISPFGLHWPGSDIDLSIDGLLQGRANDMNESQFQRIRSERYLPQERRLEALP